MALTQRLQIRQSQALVMTPQLMQAIKLLQLSNLDLVAYVDAELERNPLLEPGDADGEAAPGANGAQSADKPAEAGETWNGSDDASRAAKPRRSGPRTTSTTPQFPMTPRRAASARPTRRAAIRNGPASAPAAATTASTISKPSCRRKPRWRTGCASS